MKPVVFIPDKQALEKKLLALKQCVCPHCRMIGTLNRHDKVSGNRPDHATERQARGQRAWCSNRGKRGGCGRTVKLLFDQVLPRHTISADILWAILKALIKGLSVKAAAESVSMKLTIDSVYRLLQQLTKQLDGVRVTLSANCKPPGSSARNPLIHTAEHLLHAFPGSGNPVAAFQSVFQRPVMG